MKLFRHMGQIRHRPATTKTLPSIAFWSLADVVNDSADGLFMDAHDILTSAVGNLALLGATFGAFAALRRGQPRHGIKVSADTLKKCMQMCFRLLGI